MLTSASALGGTTIGGTTSAISTAPSGVPSAVSRPAIVAPAPAMNVGFKQVDFGTIKALPTEDLEKYNKENHSEWFGAGLLKEEQALENAENDAVSKTLDLIDRISKATADIEDIGYKGRLETTTDYMLDKVMEYIQDYGTKKITTQLREGVDKYSPAVKSRIQNYLARAGFRAPAVGAATLGVERATALGKGVARGAEKAARYGVFTEAGEFIAGLGERAGGAYIKATHDAVDNALNITQLGRIPVLGELLKNVGHIGASLYNDVYVLAGGKSDEMRTNELRDQIQKYQGEINQLDLNLSRIQDKAQDYISRERRSYHDDILLAREADELLKANKAVFEGMTKRQVANELRRAGYNEQTATTLGEWVYRFANPRNIDVRASQREYQTGEKRYVIRRNFRLGGREY